MVANKKLATIGTTKLRRVTSAELELTEPADWLATALQCQPER